MTDDATADRQGEDESTFGGEPDFGEDEAVGDNIFGGSEEREPIEPGRPDAENVLFVLLGILVGVLVVMRLIGAI